MKLSIVIPVFNEKDTILGIIKRVESVKLKGIKKEIILVDDCSTDGTREILSRLKKEKRYIILYHRKNFGKGRAIRNGFRAATGDLLMVQDADLEYDPNEYPKLLRPITQLNALAVYGARFVNYNKYKRIWIHYFGNQFLTKMTNLLFFTKLNDMETCYKVFTRKALSGIKIRSKRFDFEPEITAKILKKGIKIYEVPITYKPRGFEEGKKINWRDGIIALWTLIKYRFTN